MKFVDWKLRAAIIAALLSVALGATAVATASTCSPTWNEFSTSGTIYGLSNLSALSPSDAWSAAWVAQSQPVLEHWDGSFWNVVSTPPALGGATPKILLDVSAQGMNDVWAVGAVNNFGVDGESALLAHWDGTSWGQFSPPRASRYGGRAVAVSAVSANDVWALVQDGYSVGGSGGSFFDHWDGTSWRVVPSATAGSVGNPAILFDVSALSPNDAWAVGSTSNAINGSYAGALPPSTLIEHWDGTSWTMVPSPSAGTHDYLTDVLPLAASDVWAAGFSGKQALYEHWDGTSWRITPSPLLDGITHSVGIAAVSPADVWAVGSTVVGNSDRMFVEHWDGTSWSVVSTKATVQKKGLEAVSAFPDGTVLAVGSGASPPPGHSLTARLCELRVLDAGFSAKKSSGIGFGATVAWNIDSADALAHSVTDGTGMGLFDSGPRPPGGSFTYEFPAAGNYRLIDRASGHTSAVSVGMTAKPTSGTATTAFSIGWAAAVAPSGFVHDVQVSRPGPTVYADLLTGTANPGATFTPDAGVGTYAFRARIRNTGNGASSGWSSAKIITVS